MTDTHIERQVDPSGSDPGGSTLSTASDHAKELTHHAGDELDTVVGTAKEQTRGLIDEARSHAADEADAVTSRAAEALSGTAKDLRDLATGHGSPDTQVAGLAREAGDRIDRVAVQLRDRGYQGVSDDVTRWARAHPGAFLGLAVGAGFVIGRVFRAADTKAVADAARGSSSSTEYEYEGGPSSPQLGAGNASLPAGERPTTSLGGSPGSGSVPRTSEPQIDLTDPPGVPGAGV